jgi:hypothetical protein
MMTEFRVSILELMAAYSSIEQIVSIGSYQLRKPFRISDLINRRKIMVHVNILTA